MRFLRENQYYCVQLHIKKKNRITFILTSFLNKKSRLIKRLAIKCNNIHKQTTLNINGLINLSLLQYHRSISNTQFQQNQIHCKSHAHIIFLTLILHMNKSMSGRCKTVKLLLFSLFLLILFWFSSPFLHFYNTACSAHTAERYFL